MHRREFLSALAATALVSSKAFSARRSVPKKPVSMGRMLSALARRKDSAPAVAKAVKSLLEEADRVARSPIVRRVYKYGDVGKHRTWLDTRTKYLKGKTREVFALAMSDYGTNGAVAKELPLLAAAVTLTNNKSCLKRLEAQLLEMVIWSPLQRPGWTCYAPGRRLPRGGDGNWLATGTGVRAIADTLEILPADALSKKLRGAVDKLLAREIPSIVDDWRSRRPWFVRLNNPLTNQWVLPTEGLVRACLLLGVDNHREAYELGVKNLRLALDAHGPAGEFEEGIGYAAFTVTSLASAARAMARANDRRAIDHPFLAKFGEWAVQHIQPGGMLINCFDCGMTRSRQLREYLTYAAVMLDSDVARWAVEHCTGGPSTDLMGLFYRAQPSQKIVPPKPFAAYTRAARVNWRSNWGEDATGIWIRGGHRLDQHDHNDRGHVNLIFKGRPILIEAGTPSYGHPRIHSHFSTGYGHNVPQIGLTPPKDSNVKRRQPPGWQKNRTVAPLTVHRLDARGGDVTVKGDKCYDGLKQWRRRVKWDAATLRVIDTVELADGKEDVILFRWHLGTGKAVKIGRDVEGNVSVTLPDARLTISASTPVDVTQTKAPDATLKSKKKGEDHLHTCLVVRSHSKVKTLKLTTTVIVP